MMPITGSLQFLDEFYCLDRIEHRHILRRCDNNSPLDIRGKLDNGERLVPGPGREVNDQVVKRPPVYVIEELPDYCHLHRPAPNNRRTRIRKQECHRHDSEIPGYTDRFHVVFQHGRPLVLDAQHLGNVGPMNVEIEKADLPAVRREG